MILERTQQFLTKYDEHRQYVLDAYSIDLNDITFLKFLLLYNQAFDFETPRMHYDMAQWLDDTNDESLRCLQAYRHSGKSYLSGLWCIWKWLRDPEYRILLISASKDLAADKCSFIAQVIENFWLVKHLKPEKAKVWRADALIIDRRNASNHFSLRCVSTESRITGKHANIIVADDVEIKENVETQGMREKLWKTVRSLRSICKNNFYIGTPHAEEGESIYWKMNTEWQGINLPTLKIPVYGKDGVPTNPDVMMDGFLHDQAWIETQKIILGPAMFASQYLLSYADTTERELDARLVKTFDGDYERVVSQGMFRRTSAAHVIKLSDDTYVPLKDMVAYWDPAGGGTGHDDSVLCLMGMSEGGDAYIFELTALSPVTSDYAFQQQISEMVEILIRYNVNQIHVETTGFKQIVGEIKRYLHETRNAWIRVVPLTHNGNQYISNEKKSRIRNYLGTQMTIGRLFCRTDIWTRSKFRGQIQDFPSKARDDFIDAVSGALEVLRPARFKRGSNELIKTSVRNMNPVRIVSDISAEIGR